MIIDTHVHIFPDKLCPQTVEKMATTDPRNALSYHTDGSAQGTAAALANWGCDYGLMLPIVVKPEGTQAVNDFAAWVQGHYESLYACGSVHPDDPGALAAVDKIARRGLKGIKLHPDYQHFRVEEKRLYPLYEKISAVGLPVVFHSGYDPVSPDLIHATPAGLRQVAEDFPELTIVAAHTGGLFSSPCARDIYLGLPNFYLDTSMASHRTTPEVYRQLMDIYGAERFLFATDCPWSDGGADLDFLSATGLSEDERALILAGNAQRVFKLHEEINTRR